MCKTNIHKIVGSKIKKLRVEKKLTQTELANLVFSSQAEIHHIEQGKRKLDVERLVNFSKVLNRDVIYFLSDFVD
jgi:transcriptional regulator with XRE-family HTH domain